MTYETSEPTGCRSSRSPCARGVGWRLVVFVAAALLVAGVLWRFHPNAVTESPIARIERLLAARGAVALPLDVTLPDGVGVVRWQLPDAVADRGFYLRSMAAGRAILLMADEPARTTMAAGTAGNVAPPDTGPLELSVYRSGVVWEMPEAETAAHVVRVGPVRDWELFEIMPEGSASLAQSERVFEFELTDGFMRHTLAKDDGWRVHTGRWTLNQYGGGLPRGDAESANAKFQRAVNPFSVIGRAVDDKLATLVYDAPAANGDSYYAEARFYIGRPRSVTAAGVRSEAISDFLVAQGTLAGNQVGFGWWRKDADAAPGWSLCIRRGDGDWQVLQSWPEHVMRGNWTRVGLSLREGHLASPSIDGRTFGDVSLPFLVRGPLHMHASPAGGSVEFDDVSVSPRAATDADHGEPYFRASANFQDKDLLDADHDPEQFEFWAKGANTFIRTRRPDPVLGLEQYRARTRLPLYGDFTYRSMPDLPEGAHRFLILARQPAESPQDVLADFTVVKSAGRWTLPNRPETSVFTLEFGRRDNRLELGGDGALERVSEVGTGPLHLIIIPPERTLYRPHEQEIIGTRIWHELFEEAPSDWYSNDGKIGMNHRWACQEDWNFMVGQSPRLCALYGKAAYLGDQEIDLYLALTATLPSESQYYIRRDLGISFCTDGRNLDSGYTIIFGADNNQRTVLLKGDTELAATTEARFLFPTDPNHRAVHWKWWNFHIVKVGNTVRILLNDETLFEVEDPAPLAGGQIALWTVNNGFVVSRITAVAENRELRPENAFLPPEEAVDGAWTALLPDTVLLRRKGALVEVENLLGGGPFAVRHAASVDVAQFPVLDVPLELEEGAKVNLHVQVGRQSWLVPISAPVEDTRFLLTPEAGRWSLYGRRGYEGTTLQRVLLPAAPPEGGRVRVALGDLLRERGVALTANMDVTLTIGNSSEHGYLIAGFGGNRAGAVYRVGDPKWIAAEPSP